MLESEFHNEFQKKKKFFYTQQKFILWWLIDAKMFGYFLNMLVIMKNDQFFYFVLKSLIFFWHLTYFRGLSADWRVHWGDKFKEVLSQGWKSCLESYRDRFLMPVTVKTQIISKNTISGLNRKCWCYFKHVRGGGHWFFKTVDSTTFWSIDLQIYNNKSNHLHL